MKKIKGLKKAVKKLSVDQIIDSMILGLREPITDVISMGTYGHFDEGVCFGCAATNTILKIGNISSDKIKLYKDDLSGTLMSVFKDSYFVDRFETAINSLRLGNLEDYNTIASTINIALIPLEIVEKYRYNILALLRENYLEDLHQFEDLSKDIKEYLK